jgi:hypothetical protein
MEETQSPVGRCDSRLRAGGGKELRAFVSDQVDRLRLARHNLFCGLAPGRGVAV